MSDTSFGLVNVVLHSLDTLIKAKYGVKTDAVIQSRIQRLSAQYQSLGSAVRTPIDYAVPVTRLAYVFSYVAAHSSYVRTLLLETEDSANF